MKKDINFRKKVENKYLRDKRYNATPSDVNQRYSLRNKFGMYFEYRKFKESVNLFNCVKLNLSGMKILDVGCHKGYQLNNLAFLKGTSKGLYGIDFMSHFINVANEINPSIKFKREDVHNLKFKDGFFDLITLYYFLNCISPFERKDVAEKLTRKVKVGGYMLVFEFFDSPLVNFIRKVSKTVKGVDNSYVEYANDCIVKKYFKNFRIIKSKKIINVFSFPLSRYLSHPMIEIFDSILPKNYYIALLKRVK